MAKEIKYICDFCGKEIENKNDRADIVFHDVGMTLNVHLSCLVANLDLSKKERNAIIKAITGDCTYCGNSDMCKEYPCFCINHNMWKLKIKE